MRQRVLRARRQTLDFVLDSNLQKNFRMPTEGHEVQFRWESFNLFNNANFDGVSLSLGAANFGQVTSARDPRTMQFGLKFIF